MTRALVAALAVLAGCSSPPSVDYSTIDDLGYFIPTGWTSRDLSNQQRMMFEWRPDDNPGKQSVAVIRTDRRAELARADIGRLEQLLERAQRGLPRGTFSAPRRIRTQQGFLGVQVEGQFVPAGQAETYQRIHAVLLDRESLVHVVYTARDPDRRAFETVLESLRRQGGA